MRLFKVTFAAIDDMAAPQHAALQDVGVAKMSTMMVRDDLQAGRLVGAASPGRCAPQSADLVTAIAGSYSGRRSVRPSTPPSTGAE